MKKMYVMKNKRECQQGASCSKFSNL